MKLINANIKCEIVLTQDINKIENRKLIDVKHIKISYFLLKIGKTIAIISKANNYHSFRQVSLECREKLKKKHLQIFHGPYRMCLF